jgi:molecular chaperone GrpE
LSSMEDRKEETLKSSAQNTGAGTKVDETEASAQETSPEGVSPASEPADEGKDAVADAAKESSETTSKEEGASSGDETSEASEIADEAAGSEGDAGDASGDDGEQGRALDFKTRKELEKKDAQIADLKDRYQRTLAEYQNFRSRSEKEKSDLYSFAVRDVMEKILPVLDNLERGLSQIPEEAKEDAFAQGMTQMKKQFEKALSDIGIEPIEAVGKEFDPNLHNAVMHIDDDQYGDNVVVQELQKGYTYRGTVVRHSMVQVAN